MLHLITAPFVMLALNIGLIACIAELIDIGIGSIFFLISGKFVSVIDSGLLLGMSWVSLWNLNTGLVGFDFLLNAYLNLQFTPEGRWSLLGISALVFLIAVAYGIAKDKNLDELIDTNTSTGAWVVFSAALPSLIFISPMWIALFAGLMSKIFGVP
jgi:hypothetical protein